MELKPEALSEDGYIIDQRQTDNLRFGALASSKNGCGWIAAYNFLKTMDRNPDPERTLRQLERTLLAGGRLGVHFFALAAYLHRQGIPLEVAIRPIHAQLLTETCRGGIILYNAGRTNHFAAFRREPDGKLRFFGAEAGNSNEITSLATFRDRHVKLPLMLVLTAR